MIASTKLQFLHIALFRILLILLIYHYKIFTHKKKDLKMNLRNEINDKNIHVMIFPNLVAFLPSCNLTHYDHLYSGKRGRSSFFFLITAVLILIVSQSLLISFAFSWHVSHRSKEVLMTFTLISV